MSDLVQPSPLSNPINLLLLIPSLYLLSVILIPPSLDPTAAPPLPSEYDPDVYNWLPARHPDVLVYRKFTTSDLSAFDGKEGGRICLAIMRVGRDGVVAQGKRRTVFDVSSGRVFYGPGTSSERMKRRRPTKGRWDVW